jgi:MoaA/NifB/PqqE/SkfB family radical SAM enzyme
VNSKRQRLADHATKNLGVFFTPRADVPVCNLKCSHCSFYAFYKEGEKAIAAKEVPSVIAPLKEQGFNISLFTSEILLAENWKEILRANNDNYVDSNGILIARKGKGLLYELRSAGVSNLTITANVSESHRLLGFSPEGIVDAAFGAIRRFNAENPAAAFRATATVVLTAENSGTIGAICSQVRTRYLADAVKFVVLNPVSELTRRLAPSIGQVRESIRQINEVRESGKYAKEEFFIQRSGSLGTYGLPEGKKSRACPAGNLFSAVISLENGADVRPCIHIRAHPIGSVQGGKIIIDEGKLSGFLKLKEKALDDDYCPAHAINTGKI